MARRLQVSLRMRLGFRGWRGKKRWEKNLKGRDIGYALAANSCEGVNDVEACTVTAP
jgi:hypothetical protein